MARKKYLLYPYSHETYGLVKGFLLNNEAMDVIAPIGAGLINKDISYAVNRTSTGIIVKDFREIDFKDYDTVIISSHMKDKLYEDEMLEILDCIKKTNTEVIYLGKDEEIDIRLKSCNRIVLDETQKINDKIETMIRRYNELDMPLYKPKVPIVYIGGILETIDSFDIGLQIKVTMERAGYKVSLISKEMDGKIFGTMDYPMDFMAKNISPENQIISVNRYIQAIDYVEKPDIILMDIPKGMMQYSNSFHNSFGIYAYMIAQTIKPDYFILTVPQAVLDGEYIEEINQYFKSTIKKEIDILNVSNAIYDVGTQTIDELDKPLYISEKDMDVIVDGTGKDYELSLVNLNRREDIDFIINNIIEKFA